MKKIRIGFICVLLVSAGFLSGCTETNKKPSAVISAHPLSGEASLTVVFNASSSTDEDGAIVNYTWDFGNNHRGYGIEVIHTYTTSGNYTVKLFVTDEAGESDTETVLITVLPPSIFTQEQAVDLLMRSIIDADNSDGRISAFMLSNPIDKGEVIVSEGGQEHIVGNDSWFVFIDDRPNSFYAHPTRYVFINARDGSYQVIDESWPPLINNVSLWDTTAHGMGSLLRFYVVPRMNQSINDTGNSGGASTGDYGDAPDMKNAYYGVQGQFPTYYNTTNSRFGLTGGHTLNVGGETIGSSVSAEIDANDTNDPDLVPNLVDADKDDRVFVILSGTKKAKFSFSVHISQNAPDVPRYVNILVDFDQNGSWCNGSYGVEWSVINMPVDVDPGSSKTIITPEFAWGDQSILPSPVWVRIALTREQINTSFFNHNWDGSGQFEYGEIEDHLVYLTDDVPDPEDEWPPWPGNPPGGRNPNPVPPPGPQNPGPAKGPCGTDVNYYCIIINGGDSRSHLSKGLNPAQQATDTMTDLATDQGYTIVGNLGPTGSGTNSNSLSSIESALQGLKSQVKCGDHVLIYIVGHGNKASDGAGINLKGGDGKTDELLTPNKLANLLGNNLPPCPDEDCDVPSKCCHVTVVIESCYAGNFNVPGVTGPGRTVMGSSDDEPAVASNGGAFTQGFSQASRDEDSDTDDEAGVNPGEAFDGAEDSVDESNKKSGGNQEPWKNSQECECKCPCSPNISVNKTVTMDGVDWFDEVEAPLGLILQFDVEVENTGKCRNVTTLEIVDTIPSCMSFTNGSAELYIGSVSQGVRAPDAMEENPDGSMDLTWELEELNLLAPGESFSIRYSAIPEVVGENVNEVNASAQCTYDSSVFVYAEDSVIVTVYEP